MFVHCTVSIVNVYIEQKVDIVCVIQSIQSTIKYVFYKTKMFQFRQHSATIFEIHLILMEILQHLFIYYNGKYFLYVALARLKLIPI